MFADSSVYDVDKCFQPKWGSIQIADECTRLRKFWQYYNHRTTCTAHPPYFDRTRPVQRARFGRHDQVTTVRRCIWREVEIIALRTVLHAGAFMHCKRSTNPYYKLFQVRSSRLQAYCTRFAMSKLWFRWFRWCNVCTNVNRRAQVFQVHHPRCNHHGRLQNIAFAGPNVRGPRSRFGIMKSCVNHLCPRSMARPLHLQNR